MAKKAAAAAAAGETAKPKYTKSRNGCVTCKKRRLKCDETKPYCQNCLKRGIVCGGYAVNFKWRDFSETVSVSTSASTGHSNAAFHSQQPTMSFVTSTMTPNNAQTPKTKAKANATTSGVKQKPAAQAQAPPSAPASAPNSRLQIKNEPLKSLPPKGAKDQVLAKALEEATLSVTGRSTKEIAIANLLISQGKNPDLALAVASTLNDIENNESVQKLLNDKNFNESILLNLGENMQQQQTQVLSQPQGKMSGLKTTERDSQHSLQRQRHEGTVFEPASEVDQSDGEIDAKLLQENDSAKPKHTSNLNPNNSLLHSLADIAARSPTYPLSPFNDPFSLEPFSNKQRLPSLKTSTAIATATTTNKLLAYGSLQHTMLPPLSEEIISVNRNSSSKDSPLNLFKESPQSFMISAKSQTSFMQSYHLSNNPTPKFDDMDSESGFQPYPKFSPMPQDINSPSINAISSLLNDHEQRMDNTSVQQQQQQQQQSFSNDNAANMGLNMQEINTPRTSSNMNNQLSPFSAMFQLPIASQQLAKSQQHTNNNVSGTIEEIQEVASPNSVTSETSTTLGYNRHSNSMIQFQQSPVDLFAMHIPDEHLAMLLAFDQHTCGIMSIKNGPTENPWRSFLLPMSVDHPVVRSALLAMTCFHVARGDVAVRERGVKYMKHAIVSLVHGLSNSSNNSSSSSGSGRKLLKDGRESRRSSVTVADSRNNTGSTSTSTPSSSSVVKKIPPDVALATCIALAMGEAWDRHISTGIAHLKGAKSMIIRVLNKLQGKKKRRGKRHRSESMSSLNTLGSSISELAPNENGESGDKSGKLNTIDEERDNEEVEDDQDLKEKKLPKELQFLVNAWMYFDVLARMTSDCADELDKFDEEDESDDAEDAVEENSLFANTGDNDLAGSSIQSANSLYDLDSNISPESAGEIASVPLKRRSSSFPTLSSSKRLKINRSKQRKKSKKGETDSASVIEKFRSFNLEEGDVIDPLLGVAQTLFPIMGRVATLISKVRQYKLNNVNTSSSKMSTSVKTPLRLISKAVELKSEIERWKLPNIPTNLGSSTTEDPSFDLNAAMATAEAYRYATLLYLHQTIPEVPCLTSHSLAENVMMLLASVPGTSRTLVTHMFPLFVASCEARPGEEREWAKERWLELIDKMWIGNLERSWEVIKEVWARKDAFYAKKQSMEQETDENVLIDDDGPAGNTEYRKVKRRISRVIQGSDEDLINDEDNHVGNWTHWTSVMKDWGWEVLLA